MTQTVIQSQEELTTYTFMPSEELDDENRRSLVVSKYSIPIPQNIPIASQIDVSSYCKKIKDIGKVDPVNELILTQFLSFINRRDDTEQTETISSDELEQTIKHSVSNVVVSEQAASKLRAKEVSAFVPVSATDLIWLEALSMDDFDE